MGKKRGIEPVRAMRGVESCRVIYSAPQNVSGQRRRGLRRFYIREIHLHTATVQQRRFFSSGGFYVARAGAVSL